jgi:hypothetical protein
MSLLAVTIVMKKPTVIAKFPSLTRLNDFLAEILYYPTFKGGTIVYIRIKTMFLCLSVVVALGIAASNSVAQSTGPAAFAAKQEIKAQVLSAMEDGAITQDERRNILSNAKDILSAKEYVGLVETLNRLSPPDTAVPEDVGYTPVVDKQLMANFPAPDLPSIEKTKLGKAISKQPLIKDMLPKKSFLAEIMPKQTYAVKEKTPKQTYTVKEIITKQTIVTGTPPNQSVVKETAPKQSVAKVSTSKQTFVKATTPKQTTVKQTKPNATSKVVILPPPPPQKNSTQPNASAVSKVQNKTPKSDIPTSPMPPAVQVQTRSADADKPVQQNTVESLKKRLATGDQVTIQQPLKLLNEAEKSPITRSYVDYSVPVLTTPAAAYLFNRDSDTIKASFDQPLEPEPCQSIVRP